MPALPFQPPSQGFFDAYAEQVAGTVLLPGAGMFEAALGACHALAGDSISTAPALVHVSIPAALQLPVPEVSCPLLRKMADP